MSETRHFINGIEIRPVNADTIGLKLDWTNNANELELTTDTIILANRAKQIVLTHLDNLGAFEGIPYQIAVGNTNLDYYIDLTEGLVLSGVGDSQIEVTIKKRFGLDSFFERANGVSFELINKANAINTIDIPYLIVKDNQLEMLIMLAISIYTLTKALIEGIRDLVIAVTDFIKIIFIGTGVSLGQIISAVLLLVARIVYVAALLIALIELTKQVIELIFPPVRNFKGATVLELLNKGCANLGYTFKSTLLNEIKQLTILPVPLKKVKKSIFTNLFTLDNGAYNKGYPTARDSTPTLGILLRKLTEIFNAKVRILDGVVRLEKRDYWTSNAGLQIDLTLNLQDSRENQWRLNMGDAWKRYFLHYEVDVMDLNTYDNFEVSDCEFSTEPLTVNNTDLVSIKGLVDIQIPFALATRKDKFSVVEKFSMPFAELADSVISFFGGSSSLLQKVQARIGVLQISQLYFSKTKLMFQVGGRQQYDWADKIGALSIYDNYHTTNEVRINAKKVYTERIPFSESQFNILIGNNYVFDNDGNQLEILTFEWINEAVEAEITYTVFSEHGKNTKTILING